ncbi:MAG: hypothetical protein ACOX8Q_05210 [Christensenellales bacterium]|jgi:hypothetical protein
MYDRSYVSRGKPPWTPLVNSHMRFYFSNPDKQDFTSVTERRKHDAVRFALDALTPPNRERIRLIMTDGRPIHMVIRELSQGDKAIETALFKTLSRTSRAIAEKLHYCVEGAWNR